MRTNTKLMTATAMGLVLSGTLLVLTYFLTPPIQLPVGAMWVLLTVAVITLTWDSVVDHERT